MTDSLGSLLAPRSVVLVGASDRERSVGAKVARNLLEGRYKGEVWFFNAKHREVAGRPTFPSVDALPGVPDLAVLCTPARTLPALVEALGRKGCRTAVIITAGLDAVGEDGRRIDAAVLAAARESGLRLLGPNCVGLLSPGQGLNASFAHRLGPSGELALVAQSGALTTALLDWASAQGIGFSHCLSLGNALDIGFPELLDLLRRDEATGAILLYIESITDGPRFLAAAEAASRVKPVIVVKSGRAPEGARAAASHTGALAGSDEVYGAAFRRAGVLRVAGTRELFDVAEALARCEGLSGERLAIVTNGGGPAILATDALIAQGGQLAKLSVDTIAALDAALPAVWSHGNPVDIVGDAPPSRYAEALRLVLSDDEVDAALLIHAPTAIVPAEEIIAACLPVAKRSGKPLLTCWMGGDAVRAASDISSAAGLAVFETPEEAVEGFVDITRYRALRDEVRDIRPVDEVPSALKTVLDPLLAAARRDSREWLSEVEAKQVLAACGIPVVSTGVARDAVEAGALAAALEGPVALKVLSRGITHKSDVGGVALGLEGREAVETAANAMSERIRSLRPDVRLEGFTVQPMIDRAAGEELLLGIATDPVFGRVLLFGAGGIAVELKADKALELLPVDRGQIRRLVDRTRIAKLLSAYRNRPALDRSSVESALHSLDLLSRAVPELRELDINPLLATPTGVVALDARIRLRIAPIRAGD
ncbi:MAG: hypothetical protein RLZZ200_3085 [Pseudomonadota bacterium]|jgi:acetyltransferase